MTHEEYLELASLWNEGTVPAEQEEVAQMARRVPARARLTQIGELALVVALSLLIVAAILWRTDAATMLVGGLILARLGWSAWKRHRLSTVASLVDESDRYTFVSTALRGKEAELNRSAIGLALILPGTLLAAMLGHALRQDGADSFLAQLPLLLSNPRGLISLGFLGCAILMLSLSHWRLVNELRRLRELCDDYVEELRRDGAGRS